MILFCLAAHCTFLYNNKSTRSELNVKLADVEAKGCLADAVALPNP